MKLIKKLHLIIILVLLSMVMTEARAQQFIINIPNADILEPGQPFIAAGAAFRPFTPDKNCELLSILLYGIGYNTEVMGGINGINMPNDISPNFTMAIKKNFNITNTTKFTVTLSMFPELSKSTTPPSINYANLSQEIPKIKTRFTVGLYVANEKSFLPNKPGMVLGFEQPLFHDRVILAADWTSRNEPYGYGAAGLKAKTFKDIYVVAAIRIPNGDNAKLGFIFYIAKDLNVFNKRYKANLK